MRSRLWSCAAVGAFLAICLYGVPGPAGEPQRPSFPVDGVRVAHVQMLGDALDSNPARLLRSLGISRGAPYDSARVEKARRELLDIGWLRTVDVLVSSLSPDSLVVVVLVERAPRARLLPLLDLRPDDRIVAGGQLYAWGRSGRGERFLLRVAGGGQEVLQAEWIEPRPWVRLPVGLHFRAEVFQELEEAEGQLEFDRLGLHASVAFPHRGPRLELSGSLLQMRASEPEGTLASGNVDHLRRGTADFVWGGSPASFEWSALRGRLGVGATSGAAENQDVHTDAQMALPVSGRLVVAAGWSYREVRGLVPRYDRVHLGGGPTLRAHDYAVANGDGGTWGGLELRVPVNFWSPASFDWTTMPLALHAFADAGTAWSASAPGARSEASERRTARWRWSAGLGLTLYYRHAYPLRVDFGAADDGKWRADIATSFPF